MEDLSIIFLVPLHRKLSTKKITSCSFLLVAGAILLALCFPTSVVISSCCFFGKIFFYSRDNLSLRAFYDSFDVSGFV